MLIRYQFVCKVFAHKDTKKNANMQIFYAYFCKNSQNSSVLRQICRFFALHPYKITCFRLLSFVFLLLPIHFLLSTIFHLLLQKLRAKFANVRKLSYLCTPFGNNVKYVDSVGIYFCAMLGLL